MNDATCSAAPMSALARREAECARLRAEQAVLDARPLAVGTRVRWDGDRANPAHEGAIVGLDGQTMIIRWDGEERLHTTYTTLMATPRWHQIG